MNVVVNGQLQNFPEDMTPFITGGRTFLPVRGIANVFDVPVEWYGRTSTVYLGDIPQGTPFFQTFTPFQSGRAFASAGGIGTVNMMGNPYPNTLRLDQQPGQFNNDF